MRFFLATALLASPGAAWEFTPGLPCLLTHETAAVQIELTYDPTQPIYTLSLTRKQPWPDAPVFSMRFDGPNPISIATDRQTFNADRRTLTVTDSGFGNVLNGLQFNEASTATLGDIAIKIPLSGAARPVAAFRQCRPSAGV